MRIVDYYYNHEWLRWILFLPLLVLFQAFFMKFVYFINPLREAWILEYVFFPLMGGAGMIFFTYLLAPRWHDGFAWFWIILGVFCGILGIIGHFLNLPEQDISVTIAGWVWTISAFVTKRNIQKKMQDSA